MRVTGCRLRSIFSLLKISRCRSSPQNIQKDKARYTQAYSIPFSQIEVQDLQASTRSATARHNSTSRSTGPFHYEQTIRSTPTHPAHWLRLVFFFYFCPITAGHRITLRTCANPDCRFHTWISFFLDSGIIFRRVISPLRTGPSTVVSLAVALQVLHKKFGETAFAVGRIGSPMVRAGNNEHLKILAGLFQHIDDLHR